MCAVRSVDDTIIVMEKIKKMWKIKLDLEQKIREKR